MNTKYKNCKQITSAQIICNTPGNYGCNVDLVAEVKQRKQVKIDEEQVVQYYERCNKEDKVLAITILPEIMTAKQLKEVLAP